jgi:hypothetical protein
MNHSSREDLDGVYNAALAVEYAGPEQHLSQWGKASMVPAASIFSENGTFDSGAINVKKYNSGVGFCGQPTWRARLAYFNDTCMPLLIDKHRNNIRSRALLALVYGTAAAFVTVLLVLSFVERPDSTITVRFSVAPPSSMPIGGVVPQVSVQVLDAEYQGISGLQCGVILLPVKDISLNVELSSGVVVSRLVSCFRSMMNVNSTTFSDDLLFCMPQAMYLMLGSTATQMTDDTGTFTLTNFSLGFGYPGTYMFLCGCTGLEQSVSSFIDITANLLDLTVTASPHKPRLPMGLIDEPEVVNMTATWTSDKPPYFVCAAVIALDLYKFSPSRSTIKPPDDLLFHTSVGFTRQVQCTTDIFPVATMNSSTSSQSMQQYTANISVPFSLYGSMTNDIYLGLAFMGSIRTLSSQPSMSDYQMPTEAVLPFGVETNVTAVLVEGLNDSIPETAPMNVTVSIVATSPSQIGVRKVFITSQPSFQNSPRHGVAAELAPFITPKSIIYGVQQVIDQHNANITTPAGMAVSFSNLRFSNIGSTGFYDVFVSCDGVFAQFPGPNGTAQEYFTIRVTSVVDPNMSSIYFSGGLVSQPEHLGRSWTVLPIVSLRDSAGKVLVGKGAYLRGDTSAGPAVVGVKSVAIASNEEGLASFAAASVTYLVGGPGVANFEVVLDDIVVARFSRTILFDTFNFSNNDQTINVTRNMCSYVKIISTPPQMFSDLSSNVVFQAVNFFGDPVPLAVVYLVVSANFARPPVGETESVTALVASANGTVVFPVRSYESTGSFGFLATVTCGIFANTFSAYFRNRVKKLIVEPVGYPNSLTNDVSSWRVRIVPYHWASISQAAPICLYRSPNWGPAYYSGFYGQEKLQNFSSVACITSDQDNDQIVSIGDIRNSPGIFSLVFNVNGNIFGPVAFVTFKPLVTNVTVIRSAFLGLSGDYPMGVVNDLSKAVLLLQDAQGNSVSGVRCIARPAVVFNATARMPMDAFADVTAIVNGVLVSYGNATNISAAFSSYSNESGITEFTDIMSIGGLTNFNYSFVYCTALDVVFDMTQPFESESFCADDPLTVTLSPNDNIALNLSVTAVSGTPGQYLPSITIQATFASGAPLPIVYCAPQLAGVAGRVYLSFNLQAGALYGQYYQLSTTLTLTNAIMLTDDMPEGTYFLYFACAGAISPFVTVTVSNVVAQLPMIAAPPYQFVYDQIVGVSLMAVGASGQPISGASLLMSITPVDQDCKDGLRSPCQCGTLLPQSIVFSKSDSDGTAGFLTAFACAAGGEYVVEVVIPPRGSSNELKQLAVSNVYSVMGLLGQSYEETVATITATAPSMVQLLGPMRLLAVTPAAASTEAFAVQQLTSLLGLQVAPSASTSQTVVITNSVAEVRWKDGQPWSYEASMGNILDATPVTGTQVAKTFVINDCPAVVLLNASGMPVANRTLNVELFPASASSGAAGGTATIAFSPTSFADGISNEAGEIALCPLTFTTSVPGVFPVLITSRGGGGLQSSIVITPASTLSRKQLMEYDAAFMLIFLSPLLMASVPYTRMGYLVAGSLVLLAGVAQLSYQLNLANFHVPYFLGYQIFTMILIILAGIMSLAVTVSDAIGYDLRGIPARASGIYRLRVFNDEPRAQKILGYAIWITNITAEKQKKVSGETDSAAPARDFGAEELKPLLTQEPILKDAIERPSSIDSLSESQKSPEEESTPAVMKKSASSDLASVTVCVGQQLISNISDKVKTIKKWGRRRSRRQRLLHATRPTLKYDRPDLEAVNTPFSFFIVVALTAAILVTLLFLILYVLRQITFFFNKILVFLPSTSNNPRIQSANDEIVSVLSAGIGLIVQKFPELGSLTNLIPRLRGINVLVYISDIRDNLSRLLFGIKLLFMLSGVVSSLAVVIALLVTYRKIPNLILSIRRGQLKLPDKCLVLTPVEGSIGLHVMVLMFLQVLTFVLVALVGIVLALPATHRFVLGSGPLLLVTFGSSYIGQRLVEEYYIGRHVTKGSFVVIPQAYAVWHFVALVLGVFTGIMQSISRWGTAIALLTFSFASVEVSVMPSAFQWMDKAHVGFMCTVNAEAVNSNPLMLVFCSVLSLSRELRATAALKAREPQASVHVDELLLDQRQNVSAVVVNLVRLLGRRTAAAQTAMRSQGEVEAAHRELLAAPCMLDLSLEPCSGCDRVTLEPFIEDVAWRRRERVRQRLWLWWLLHKNPSLRLDRKHHLEYVGESDDE